MVPSLVALALQSDGWWVRSDIIWVKKSPMPESVTDRPTSSYEHVFLLTKAARYYYDQEAVREPKAPVTVGDPRGNTDGHRRERGYPGAPSSGGTNLGGPTGGRNMRDVLTIATEPLKEQHFASYPQALVRPFVLAGTSERGCCAECGAPWTRVVEKTRYTPEIVAVGVRRVDASRGDQTRKLSGAEYNRQARTQTLGWRSSCSCRAPTVPCTVLDPFAGSGTTGVVAQKLGRRAILCEASLDYCELAKKRLEKVPLPLL